MDSSDPPLAVHRFHGDRHRQHRPTGARKGKPSELGDLLAAVPARVALAERSVFVRATICHQMAERAMKTKGKSRARTQRQSSTKSLTDWREQTLARMRALILEADPEMTR